MVSFPRSVAREAGKGVGVEGGEGWRAEWSEASWEQNQLFSGPLPPCPHFKAFSTPPPFGSFPWGKGIVQQGNPLHADLPSCITLFREQRVAFTTLFIRCIYGPKTHMHRSPACTCAPDTSTTALHAMCVQLLLCVTGSPACTNTCKTPDMCGAFFACMLHAQPHAYKTRWTRLSFKDFSDFNDSIILRPKQVRNQLSDLPTRSQAGLDEDIVLG